MLKNNKITNAERYLLEKNYTDNIIESFDEEYSKITFSDNSYIINYDRPIGSIPFDKNGLSLIPDDPDDKNLNGYNFLQKYIAKYYK